MAKVSQTPEKQKMAHAKISRELAAEVFAFEQRTRGDGIRRTLSDVLYVAWNFYKVNNPEVKAALKP
jgi:hypothetical protein